MSNKIDWTSPTPEQTEQFNKFMVWINSLPEYPSKDTLIRVYDPSVGDIVEMTIEEFIKWNGR